MRDAGRCLGSDGVVVSAELLPQVLRALPGLLAHGTVRSPRVGEPSLQPQLSIPGAVKRLGVPRLATAQRS